MREYISMENYNQAKCIMQYLGEIYRKAIKICDFYESEGIPENEKYRSQKAVVEMIDKVMDRCSKENRFILMNCYMKDNENTWYIPYYSQSTFYRLKKTAVEQFMETFDSLLR